MSRTTIAVLLDTMSFFSGGHEAQLREVFDAHCRDANLNLLLVFGRAVEDPHPAYATQNAIYDLVHRDRVDGVVVMTSNLAAACGEAGMARFIQRFRDLPCCCLGFGVPGIPSVVVDNRSGMRAVAEHIVLDHGYSRVAFLGGSPQNPELEARLTVFREVLAENGVPWEDELLERGVSGLRGGHEAVSRLIDRGVEFQAVVAANDTLALGAIGALREHGFRVPVDRPVTGFDDLRLSRLGNPPLTTVAKPFKVLTWHALQIVLDQISGRPVSSLTQLETELIVRRSCGCGIQPMSRRGAISLPAESVFTPAEYVQQHAGYIRMELCDALRSGSADVSPVADRLLKGLQDELTGCPDAFVRAVEGTFEDAKGDDERFRALQNAVSWLREELRTHAGADLESLWYDAISAIALANTTAQVAQRLKIEEDYAKLFAGGEQLSVAVDVATLREGLARGLPLAGYPTAFVSRFLDGSETELEPVLCLTDGEVKEVARASFPACHLYPSEAYLPDRRHTSLVFPLTFETQRLGIGVFEYSPGSQGTQLIRDQVSAALRAVALHQEIISRTTLHERSVQERQATAKRMQLLSALAGGVAHELNNALGPLLALPQVIIRELEHLGLCAEDLAEVRADVLTIERATLRASQSIKDLLTLGRQGRSSREPLELNRVVAHCLGDEFQRAHAATYGNVQMSVRLPNQALRVRGSEAQLSRAIVNLVNSALESVTGAGKVTVSLDSVHLGAPRSGYEVIEPGDYAVLAVADTSGGIPAEDLDQVFEPYFSKKQPRKCTNTGLGLAIVHGVVKEHEGFVDVWNSEDGATFALYLPLVFEPVHSSEPARTAPPTQARVLIVDDDLAQLRTGRRVLAQLGYRVDTLASGQQAYHRFLDVPPSGESPYQLIILDMVLNEEWDGLEVFERIARLFPGQKAIIVSGHAPTDRVAEAVARGIGWLAKPYTITALAQAVRTALGG